MPRMAWKTWKMSECASTRYIVSFWPAGMAARIRDGKQGPGRDAPKDRTSAFRGPREANQPGAWGRRGWGRTVGRRRRVRAQRWLAAGANLRESSGSRVESTRHSLEPPERSGEGCWVERVTGGV